MFLYFFIFFLLFFPLILAQLFPSFPYPHPFFYSPSFPSGFFPSSADGRSSFARGVDNGLGSFPLPGYPQPQQSAASFGYGYPFGSRRYPFLAGPNNYAGYGTNANTMLMMRGYGATPFGAHYATGQFLRESIFDRENFQLKPRGCGWEQNRGVCADMLGICKGGCEEFSRDGVLHDCRCVPIGYSALLMGAAGHRTTR